MRNSIPALVLIQTVISNADVTGTLRGQKSQKWEIVEPTLTQGPLSSQKFAEIGNHLAYLLWCVDPWLMGKYL